MSRSNYCDEVENWESICWRGAVASAIRGRRGQALLREMRDALDSMKEKRLIASELVSDDGDCCAWGAVALARGMDVSEIDPEDSERVAAAFGVAESLVCEIAYENDEIPGHPSPEFRWQFMRNWVHEHIQDGAAK